MLRRFCRLPICDLAAFCSVILAAALVLSGCGSKSAGPSGPQGQDSVTVPKRSPQEIALDEIRNGNAAAAAEDDVHINDHADRGVRTLAPVEEGGGYSDVPGGLPLFNQFFVFNPLTKQVGIADGSDLPNSINIQGSYGNTLIDSARFKAKRFLMGTVLVPSESTLFGYGSGCADVGISFEEHAKVMVSPNYVASPAEPGQAQQGQPTGYSVAAFFDPREYDKKSHDEFGVKAQKFVSGTLSVSRNGSRPAQFPLNFSPATPLWDIDNVPLAATGFPIIELWNVHRKTDIVEWSVEQNGKVTLKGAFGFPVVGTVPKLVYYRIDLPEGMHGHGTRSRKQSAHTDASGANSSAPRGMPKRGQVTGE
jgi:hypothetical protein